MIRRLSNFKSSNQQNKSLLDYSYFDHELYGYENAACIALNNNAADDGDDNENIPETYDDSQAPYIASDLEDSLDTHRRSQHPHTADVSDNKGVLALDSDCSSDSDSGSPAPQKKGIRRFFCMPKKSTFGKSQSPSMTSSSLRRSLRRSSSSKKTKGASLIGSD